MATFPPKTAGSQDLTSQSKVLAKVWDFLRVSNRFWRNSRVRLVSWNPIPRRSLKLEAYGAIENSGKEQKASTLRQIELNVLGQWFYNSGRSHAFDQDIIDSNPTIIFRPFAPLLDRFLKVSRKCSTTDFHKKMLISCVD